MATVRTARVVSAAPLGDRARLLALSPTDGALGFVGGQYLIFDTGLLRPDGRKVKRAYSILSADAEQESFSIAVFRLPAGQGSGFLNDLVAGAELPFSGPWGQYLPDDARPRPTDVIATDTGITAALGLLRGRGFAPQLPQARVLWLREPAAPFPDALVRDACAALGVELTIEACAAPGQAARLEQAQAAVARLLAVRAPQSAFLSGDGGVIHPLRAQLQAAGVPEAAVRLESFFNNPQRKVPA